MTLYCLDNIVIFASTMIRHDKLGPYLRRKRIMIERFAIFVDGIIVPAQA